MATDAGIAPAALNRITGMLARQYSAQPTQRDLDVANIAAAVERERLDPALPRWRTPCTPTPRNMTCWKESPMASDTPADDIADAIRDHDWLRVDHLLRQLLVTDPALAQEVYDTIQVGLEIGRRQDGQP